MDRASALIYPGSKVIAGWWRQLAPHKPQALWVAYAFLHRIEAPVTYWSEQPLDPFTSFILSAFVLETGLTHVDLERRLGIPAVVVHRVAADMDAHGFLTRVGSDHWRITAAGEEALRRRSCRQLTHGRRVFPFLERVDAAGTRLGPAEFVPIAECVHVPWQVDMPHRFDPGWLQAAFEQSAQWKEAVGFPQGLVTLNADAPTEDGQHVLLDRPERVLLVMIALGAANEQNVLGFAVKADGWTLLDRSPVLQWTGPPQPAWVEWMKEPTAAEWQESWRTWCRQKQLPTNEVEICSLNWQTPRLNVQAPPRLVQRLQAAKSELFKGDVWVLVGNGYARIGAQIALR